MKRLKKNNVQKHLQTHKITAKLTCEETNTRTIALALAQICATYAIKPREGERKFKWRHNETSNSKHHSNGKQRPFAKTIRPIRKYRWKM